MRFPFVEKIREALLGGERNMAPISDSRHRRTPYLIVACTALLVSSQFLATELAFRKFQSALRQAEYEKVGGEDNYKLLQEIQRDRSAAYLRDLEAKEPEYVRELRRKIEHTEKALEAASVVRGRLDADEIAALNEGTPSVSGSGSPIRIIEFSDFACPYCKDYHNSGAIPGILTSRSGSVSYSFKAMPNKKAEKSDRAVLFAKCVESKHGAESYFETVDAVFSASGSSAETAKAELLRRWTTQAEADACIESAEISAKADKDFGQGVYFKIRATPSTMILNDSTGEYAILVGEQDMAELEREIDALLSAKTK